MHEIILSYTRSDDPVCVARLADSLERLFGEGTVYGDVDSERAGGDWKKAIARKVSGAEVVLAVMGPTWQDLIATGPSEESERARFELNQAHDLDVPVIPVLLAQTRFDYERNLGDLAWLKDLQFFELADGQGRWNSDLARLAGEIARITSLEKRASEQEKARSTSRASHGDQSPNIGTARGGVKISYGRKSVPPPPRQPSPTPREAPAPPIEKRFLQADVFVSEDGAPIRRTGSFEQGAVHDIQVKIAPSDADRVQLDTAFPDHLLPRDEVRHELTVLLVAPDLFDGALSETIQLPRAGPSEVAKFDVTVPDDLESVQLMIIVLYRGTHLQTGYLSGPATAGEDDPRAAGFTFRRGQESAADLDHGDKPELTFYKDGRDLVIHRRGHDDLTPSMAGIDKRVDTIREALFDGAHGVYQLDSGLSTGPGLKLLRILAAQGEFMRRRLFGNDPLSEVRRVQVVSPYSADFFPVEYLYDRRPPKPDAVLCPAFAASTGVSARCDGCGAADDGSVVCPMGFWGLNRVIERQVRPIDLAGHAPPEPRTGDDLLPPVDGVVLAASDHVNDENPNEVTETLAALNEITDARSYLASDWQQWRQLSSEHQPVLLVALPHNVDNELGFQALQISADRELALNEIGTDYRPPPESVILLLGCNTAAAVVEYEDFIAGLRGAGAAVVVGTITYVLGMQAAPLAREFVRQFWSLGADQAVPLGEVVRAVRTRMVRDGNPLALAMTAFGGADWRLAPKEV
jgi:hypothetical protein